MAATLPGLKASAVVAPARFVKITGDFAVGQCVAGEAAFGISQEGLGSAPIPGAASSAAEIDRPLRVYGLGEVCELEVGAAVLAGAKLKPDANGRGITCVANDKYSAEVIRGQATAGDRALVFICRGVA